MYYLIILAMSTEYNSSPETKRRRSEEGRPPTPKHSPASINQGLTQRRNKQPTDEEEEAGFRMMTEGEEKLHKEQSEKWKRILLLVIAITVHNIPGILLLKMTFHSNNLLFFCLLPNLLHQSEV